MTYGQEEISDRGCPRCSETSAERRQLSRPVCQVCARPIERHPSRRRGDRLRFCGLACSGRAKRRVPEDELCRIVTARGCGITWKVIAAEVGCSVSTIMRALWRAQAPVRLPWWVRRNEQKEHTIPMSAATDPLDVVTRLMRWRIKLERSNSGTPLVNTISTAIGEIERLRRTNERLRHELSTLEAIVSGRPLRVGMSR